MRDQDQLGIQPLPFLLPERCRASRCRYQATNLFRVWGRRRTAPEVYCFCDKHALVWLSQYAPTLPLGALQPDLEPVS